MTIGIGILVSPDSSDVVRDEKINKILDYCKSGDYICVVSDEPTYELKYNGSYSVESVSHQRPLGLASQRNTCIRTMFHEDCEHMFIISDDIVIQDESVFERYIKASQISGLKHLSFGGFKMNPSDEIVATPKETIDYPEDVKIAFYHMIASGFQYFHRDVIKKVGFMDERFSRFNDDGQVDHSYRVVKGEFIPAFWWWPDIANSNNYLMATKCYNRYSQNPEKRDEYLLNQSLINAVFKHKHAFSIFEMPENDSDMILKKLERIQETHGKKQ